MLEQCNSNQCKAQQSKLLDINQIHVDITLAFWTIPSSPLSNNDRKSLSYLAKMLILMSVCLKKANESNEDVRRRQICH